MDAPKINYDMLAPATAERDRAQQACEVMGRRIVELHAALGKAIDYCDAATHGDGQYADERSELIRAWRGEDSGTSGAFVSLAHSLAMD